jgi:hypothetical protein
MASLGYRARLYRVSKETIESLFPNLLGSGYSIASPETAEYNCIAWAAGDHEKWWWPDQQNQYFWPARIPRAVEIQAFTKAYESLGYTVCKDAEYEDGFEKIAIYADFAGKPTHAARQLNPVLWTSKLGKSEDIEHTLDALVGPQYGYVAAIMKRPKSFL